MNNIKLNEPRKMRFWNMNKCTITTTIIYVPRKMNILFVVKKHFWTRKNRFEIDTQKLFD